MSPRPVLLPPLAESVVEGEVLSWLVQPGEVVKEGQPLLEVMTDKVTVELPSPVAGRVSRLVAQAGEIVRVGGLLAEVDTQPSEQPAPAASRPAPAPVTPPPVPPPPPAAPPEPAQAMAELREERSIIEGASAAGEDLSRLAAVFAGFRLPQEQGARQPVSQEQMAQERAGSTQPASRVLAPRVLASPSARQQARQQGVALEEVRGSGTGGTVRHTDVLQHVAQHAAGLAADAPPPVQPAPAPPNWPPPPPASYRTPAGMAELETRTPFRGPRRAISQALLAATLYTAQTHTIAELDCTALMRLRDELRPEAEAAGVRLSYLPFFLKAVAAALMELPALNASLDELAGEIVSKRYVNLGVAVNTEAGLMVPVVRGVGAKNLLTLAAEVADLSERARGGSLRPADTQDATFTVSNIGAVGALVGMPLVTPPAVGILSLHSIVKRPVALEQGGEDVVAVRPMMYLTLGFDHRLVDGADAARFNTRVVSLLEHPGRLLLRM